MSKVSEIQKLDELDLRKTYLLLINPENIPHLAVVQHGKYFSLTYKKAIVGEPFQPYFNFLRRSGRKILFIELVDTRLNIDKIFERYQKVDTTNTTCLVPVKEALLPGSNASFIFELIPELYDAAKIEAAHQVNMDEDLDDEGNFQLTTYSKNAIFSYIDQLNQKHAQRS